MENGFSRRDFLKSTAAAAMLAGTSAMLVGQGVHAAGSDVIRIGVIGCGGRGTGAAKDCIAAAGDKIKIVALGDLFQDRVDGCLNSLNDNPDIKKHVDIPKGRCFVGFNAYKSVINCGVDMVILAAPPGFRPTHFDAAVKAGKHVFMEKPVAVDGPGVRMVISAGELAAQKKLGVVAGTQRRHQKSYIETMKRIHDGALGDIVGGQCYWNQGGLWNHARKPEWTDMEWQCRNWLYFTWLSGDHICEQHVHNIDVINWAFQNHPEKAVGMGGREVRTDPAFGNIFDHFAIDYVYPGDVHIMSMCRQIDGCANNVSERIIGQKGHSNCGGAIFGDDPWRFEGDNPSPYMMEQKDLIDSIRAGNPINEAKTVAESCLTAIMGRMSAYTGQEITWDMALNSKEDLTPAKLELGSLPVAPIAAPGQTKFF
jgi:predicted dehydrogenase